MRFSSTVLLALPLAAAAAESPFDQYKAQFQNFLGRFTGALNPPATVTEESTEPVSAKAKPKPKPSAKAVKIESLTLETWNNTLFAPVKPAATQPEEWWVLITGRNSTCFGHCLQAETAFNESAVKISSVAKSTPHMAILNCEDQKILCNSWSASAGSLWIFEMLPSPAPIDIYVRRLNLTSTTAQTLLDLQASGSKETFKLHDGYFHPYDGFLAKNGLAVPVGYLFWAFNLVPSWGLMLVVSFVSRSLVTRRMEPPANRRNPANAAAAAPRAAAPGDGLS